MVAAERGQGTAEDLLCSEALPLQDTPRGRLKTSSLHRGLPGTTAEARVGRRGVLEEVTLKKSGGLKQHDASTDEVPSVKSKRLSQRLDRFLETSWCWRWNPGPCSCRASTQYSSAPPPALCDSLLIPREPVFLPHFIHPVP